MMQFIRNLGMSWIIILMGFVSILSGMAMTNGNTVERTLLCFDNGCVHVQGISCITIGILFIGFGVYVLFKRRKFNLSTFKTMRYDTIQ